MKKRFFLVLIIQSAVSYSQTAITSANFQEAINTCLATNPVDGLCSTSEFGAMPDWDVSNVTDMSRAFHQKILFNGDLSAWNVSNVTDMTALFNAAFSFNQDISTKEITVGENTFIAWDVSNVNNMAGMFLQAKVFNGNISNWDTSNVTNMNSMFKMAYLFNQPIGEWETSSVTNMPDLFSEAYSFNQDLNSWDVSQVTDMSYMFESAENFNGAISNWSININAVNMTGMFENAITFNQPITQWDVSAVTNMYKMFSEAVLFNQNLEDWNISKVGNMTRMFDDSGLSTNNFDALLIGWAQLELDTFSPSVTLGAVGINYCNGSDARAILTSSPNNWTINDAGLNCATAGVDDQNQLDVSIYPNPASEVVYIDGNYTQLKVVIYNVLGKELLNTSITNSVDISHLENGIYILQLSDGVKIATQKIIKN